MALLRVVASGIVALAACGRIGFDPPASGLGDASGNGPGCADGALICDDFARTTPIDATSPWWSMVDCDSQATLSVDGALEVSYPTIPGGGIAMCQLHSTTLAASPEYHLELDFTVESTSMAAVYPVVAQLEIDLATPNANGIDQEQIGLLVGDDLGANLTVVYHYPNASDSPTGTNYPGYDIADSNGERWYAFGEPCHASVTLNPAAHTGTAVSTCASVGGSMLGRNHSMDTGLSEAPTLDFGFSLPSTASQPWMLSLDNLSVSAVP